MAEGSAPSRPGTTPGRQDRLTSTIRTARADGLGGAGGADPPVPIPNTVVKRPSADDTRRAAARDNRPVPGPSPFARSCSAHDDADALALDGSPSGGVSYRVAAPSGSRFGGGAGGTLTIEEW